MRESPLYLQTQGAGPDLVLVHGWGMNGDVWEELVAQLAPRFRVTVVDLPGYGRSPLCGGLYSLENLAERLAAAVTRPATWVGWSLGGLICQQLALQHPELVERLALVCSSPRFVADRDWSCGIDERVLNQFASDMATDFRGTLMRFLALEARGSDHARDELRTLRERVFRHGEPELEAVRGGLELLRLSDFRTRLDHMECPIEMVLGERDQLVPKESFAAARALNPSIAGAIIPGASHAPFISHREIFVRNLEAFAAP